MGWPVRGSNSGGAEIFRTCPDRPNLPPIRWVPGIFPGGKAAGAWRRPPTPRVNFTFYLLTSNFNPPREDFTFEPHSYRTSCILIRSMWDLNVSRRYSCINSEPLTYVYLQHVLRCTIWCLTSEYGLKGLTPVLHRYFTEGSLLDGIKELNRAT